MHDILIFKCTRDSVTKTDVDRTGHRHVNIDVLKRREKIDEVNSVCTSG